MATICRVPRQHDNATMNTNFEASPSPAVESQSSASHHHQDDIVGFDPFEPFASWEEGPSSHDAFSHSPSFDFPQQSNISRVEKTPTRNDRLELQRETSCASLVSETMFESDAFPTEQVDDFGWPFTKSETLEGSSSNNVPFLSSAWSDLSSSSSVSTGVTHSTNTLETSVVAVPTHLFETTSAPFYFEADGTLVARAYPVPEPVTTPTPQSHPPPRTLHHTSSSTNSRKVSEVDLSSSTSTFDGFSGPDNESASLPGDRPLQNSRTVSPTSIPFPVHRSEYLRRKLDKETASVASNGRPPRSSSSTPPLSSPKPSPARSTRNVTGKLANHLMKHHHQNLNTSTSSLTEDEASLDSRGGFLYLPRQQQVQEGDSSLHSSSSSWADVKPPGTLKQPRRRRQGRGVSSNASAASGETSHSQESLDFDTYMTLQQDVAYRHAMSAGYLWQSLVGQHVRFPSTWWNGARGPSMGMSQPASKWMYLARHRVRAHALLNGMVPRRNSPGQLLVHVIVQDRLTWKPLQDIVLGCFHPNARGVRTTEHPVPENDRCREVWMAVRKRCDDVSVVDYLLAEGEKLEHCARNGPLLGSQHHVANMNLKAIFGEEPPKRTWFVTENDLHTQLVEAADHAPDRPVALLLLDQAFAKPVEL